MKSSGASSVVERGLAMPEVAGSSPAPRSISLRHGDLFSGCGGAALAFQRAGFALTFLCEINPKAQFILRRRFPGVPIHADARTFADRKPCAVDVISAGDPCPSRSRARMGRPAVHPDLAGYVLAVVARNRPRWVVRENVVSPDITDFAAGLELLGYSSVVVEADSRSYTAQCRCRHFVVGGAAQKMPAFIRAVGKPEGTDWVVSARRRIIGRAQPTASCLTSDGAGYMGVGTNILFEPAQGQLRYLTLDEAEALQGFPRGWTSGLSKTARVELIGNAWTVPVGERIARSIIAAEAA